MNKPKKRERPEIPPIPMKLMRMPDRSKGFRINCNVCFVILERTEDGTRVIVQANDANHVVACSELRSPGAPPSAAVVVKRVQ